MPSRDRKKRQANKSYYQLYRMRRAEKEKEKAEEEIGKEKEKAKANEEIANPSRTACVENIFERLNAAKAAARKKRYQGKNPENVACSKKRYQEKYPERVACSLKRYQEKNPEKVATYKKRYEDKNQEKVACSKKRYNDKNRGKVACLKRLWQGKNREKVACLKKRYRALHPDVVRQYAKNWRQMNPDKVEEVKRKWRLRNVKKAHACWWRNAARKQSYHYKEKLQQQQQARRQRNFIQLQIDRQYHRGKSMALILAGEKEAEMKFVRVLAKCMRQRRKRPHDYVEINHEAKVIVVRALNSRRKLVNDLKTAFKCLENKCRALIEKADEVCTNDDDDNKKFTLEKVCGTGSHRKGREPYFQEFAYRVVKAPTSPIPLPAEAKVEKKPSELDECVLPDSKDYVKEWEEAKTWPCDPKKCVLPDSVDACAARLVALCERICDVKKIRRCLANADKCVHTKHVHKSETKCPADVEKIVQETQLKGDDYCYGIKVLKKLGYSTSCLHGNCGSDLLFLRQLSVHYESVHTLLREFYQTRMYDRLLLKLDNALITGNYDTLLAIIKVSGKGGSAKSDDANNEVLKEQGITPEERIKSVPYALEFLKKIQQKRTFPCASCCMLHYRKDVRQVVFKKNSATGKLRVYTGKNVTRKGAEKPWNPLWEELYAFVQKKKRNINEVFVCNLCFLELSRGAKHAPVSAFNKLDVADVPKEVTELNEFEKQFIQKAKCFQVIYRLGTIGSKLPASDRVKAQKGQAVHYPLPLTETLNALPDAESMPDNQNVLIVVFGVPTKSRIVWKALVDVNKIKAALRMLKDINPEYADVNLDWDPLQSVVLEEKGDERDNEVIEACQRVAKKPMIRKIDKDEEEVIMDSYTVRPLFEKNPQESDLELYTMERVQAEAISSREAKLDLLCFPHLYPTGRNGEAEERDELNNQAFIRNRLFNEDPRFRLEQQYLFYLLHQYQLRQVASAVLQTLRSTTKYSNATVTEFVRRVAVGDQEMEGNLYTMFRQCRGTEQYWNSVRLDLKTMVRELSPPTWFVTLSAAEFDWEDMRELLLEVNKGVDGIEEMRNGERCAMDPVFTSEQFHHRFSAFVNTVLRAKGGGPLGEVVDYFVRTEYQARGAPHLHMLLWVKHALRMGVDPNEKVLEFIQEHVTCRLPDEDKEPLLHQMVTRYQMHRVCNKCCLRLVRNKNRRKYKRCRFGFPRKVTDEAVLHDALKKCGQRLKGKSNSRLYELPRTRREQRVNDYNADMLLLWGANLDVQYVGDETAAVVNYVADYVTKKEKSALQELWDVLSKNKELSKQLFNFGCRSLCTRECGAYEAADMVTGRALYKMSRTVKYINARKPHLRPRVLKTLKKLKQIAKDNPESTEKFENNWIVSYYPDRPDSMEDMCLYDFRRLHDTAPKSKDKSPTDLKTLPYKLTVRSKPYLISHPRPKYDEQREDYCYCLLLLFKPFRQESEELVDSSTASCIPVFERELDSNEKLAEYHKKTRQYQEQQEENRKVIEQERDAPSQEEQGAQEDAEVNVLGEPQEAVTAMQELNLAMQLTAEESLEDNLEKMNEDQLRIFDRVSSHLRSGKEQLLMFISGAGGTGKSFLVNTLKLWMKKEHSVEGTSIAVAAPTGLAAYNVSGVTLHRLLQLPVQHNLNAKYSPLSDDVCKELRQNLKHLKVLVIDEVSMVSNVMLAYVHLRLNQIFNAGEDKLFGGINVIVMGDLAQLTPVGDKPAFRGLTSEEVERKIGGLCGMDLWKDVFEYEELTVSMRQKDDPSFAEMLNRLRFGHTSQQDVATLKTRLIDVPDGVSPLQAFAERYASLQSGGNDEIVCLMSKCEMVAKFNAFMLSMEKKDIVETPAIDSFQYNGCPASKKAVEQAQKLLKKKGENVTDTAGIEMNLRLCVGARVMLRRNINVQDGLVNGAIGTLVGIEASGTRVTALKIKFDNVEAVHTLERSSVKFALTDQIYVTRKQFPLILAYAMTIHKSQGLSLKRVMVDVGNSIFQEGMTYVALSRVKTLDGLHMMNFDPSKANANKLCLAEINRLRTIYKPDAVPIDLSAKKLKWEPDRIWCKSVQEPLLKEKGTRKRKAAEGKGKAVKKRATAPADKAANKRKASIKETASRNRVASDAPCDLAPAAKKVRCEELQWPKFDNHSGVACYSNSAFQGLLALERFQEACTAFENSPSLVKLRVFKLLRDYNSRKVAGNERLFTTSVRNALGEPFRNVDGEQCAFEFTRILIERLELEALFEIVLKSIYRCLRCGHDEDGVTRIESFIQICPGGPSRDFDDLIRAWSPVEGRSCPACGDQRSSETSTIIEGTQDQLVIYISRYMYTPGGVINAGIENFNPDEVNVQGNLMRVTAAICYHRRPVGDGGHYWAIVRSNRYGWLNCNDENITVLASFPNQLEDATLLLLEKCD